MDKLASSAPGRRPPGRPRQGAAGQPFTSADHAILDSYRPVVQSLADLLGAHCEVVLHSLEDPRRSVVCIANGHVTGRSAGSPITDLALDMLRQAQAGGRLHQTYFSTARDGRQLKSATTLIRNGQGRTIGLLCVNLDLDVPLHRFAAAFAPAPVPGTDTGPEHLPEHFASNVADLLETSVDTVLREVGDDPAVPASQRNKQIVTALFDRGVFEIKEAIQYVAARLKVTHHTVYMHIRRRRKECGMA